MASFGRRPRDTRFAPGAPGGSPPFGNARYRLPTAKEAAASHAAGADIPGGTGTGRVSPPGEGLHGHWVQAYYLYVGTTQGASDVVDSGEMQVTSYSHALPAASRLYARLYTKVGGQWRSSDSTFTTATH